MELACTMIPPANILSVTNTISVLLAFLDLSGDKYAMLHPL